MPSQPTEPVNSGPLRKILQLEQARGFSNSAVVGGLDRFLVNWAVPAKASLGRNKRLLTRFHDLGLEEPDYASLSPAERRKWAKGVVQLLDDLEPHRAGTPQPLSVAAAPSATPKPRAVPAEAPSLESAVTVLKGVSANLAARFEKLGVRSVRDLLYFFPSRHLDYSQVKSVSELVPGEEETIIANVWQATETRPGGRKSTEAIVGDDTGNVRVVWFNNPYVARNLPSNSRIVLSGRVRIFGGQLVFESPEWEPYQDAELVHTGRLVPVYPLTKGLRSRQVRKLMKGFVDQWAGQITDFLPAAVRERCNLLELPVALAQAHYPEDEATKDRARERLAFDELFLLQLGVLSKKRDWQESQPGNPIETNRPLLSAFVASLPFRLTAAQDRVIAEMLADLARPKPMSRLLQGDVGSGKTVVATAGLLAAVAAGFQGVLMAPTEILAEQHFTTICRLFEASGEETGEEGLIRSFTGPLGLPVTVARLTGATPAAQKRRIKRLIADGGVNIVIGTHAIIQKDVAFHRLGMAVIDEQHRFGVEQRSALRQKGFNPHILVMTATPIPRTLALTLYGDLDLSVLDEMPPGRQDIRTRWLRPNQRASAYNFIRKQTNAGHQAFIICPLIEESDAIQARAATIEYQRLAAEVFPDKQLGLLHGRLSGRDKEAVMRRFYDGETDILVSTAVVEVGIDVPNATVMMIESADRFGLSQLHQFRGRVGRGPEQSYCMLMAEEPSQVAMQRLDIIENVQDGFKLAEEDLKLRGPGEFFGTRQSGLPDLRMARISDVALLERTRAEALRLFEQDPEMKKPEHAPLVREMTRVWSAQAGEWS